MKILVVGSGGREHAIIWKLKQSPAVSMLVAAPGNAGIEKMAQCIRIGSEDIEKLTEYARSNEIDLVIVGPEAPLALGLADSLKRAGIPVFGPDARAARLESSKRFAKEFCLRHNIPTAAFTICSDSEAALAAAEAGHYRCVLKADGLAAGKGVFVCRGREDVVSAIDALFNSRAFGDASARVIVEDLLEGEEASILVFVDGKHYRILESSQDHKAAYDNDTGPNTGGMGAYSPAPVVTKERQEWIERRIIRPAVEGMHSEGNPFSGVMYAGLMINDETVNVLEFNVRFGDPETQPLLFRLESDLAEIMMACATGSLDKIALLKWSDKPAVCIVMASGGYPGKYAKGFEITGLENAESLENVTIFHSGTKTTDDERIITSGGRVLGVTASGQSIRDARDRAYNAVKMIGFEGCFYRKDIACRALNFNEYGGE